jgi:hypothetical protein
MVPYVPLIAFSELPRPTLTKAMASSLRDAKIDIFFAASERGHGNPHQPFQLWPVPEFQMIVPICIAP